LAPTARGPESNFFAFASSSCCSGLPSLKSFVPLLSVDLGFDLTTGFMIRLKMEILSFWHVDYKNHSNVILVNLNLLALALILVIDQLKKQQKKEMDEELLTIGDELEQLRR